MKQTEEKPEPKIDKFESLRQAARAVKPAKKAEHTPAATKAQQIACAKFAKGK